MTILIQTRPSNGAARMTDKPSLEEFVTMWWKMYGPAFGNNELAANGQFDEMPYVEWEQMYGRDE